MMIKTANGNDDRFELYAQMEEQYAKYMQDVALHLTDASNAQKDIADSLTGVVEDIRAINFGLN